MAKIAKAQNLFDDYVALKERTLGAIKFRVGKIYGKDGRQKIKFSPSTKAMISTKPAHEIVEVDFNGKPVYFGEGKTYIGEWQDMSPSALFVVLQQIENIYNGE